MCLLSYYPPGVAPDPDALAHGAQCNPDGHGFAVLTDTRILVRHGMDPEVLIATFARIRRTHPAGPALFHSRFATHGSIGRHNCHPFRLGGDRRTVLAHNGILPPLVRPAKGDRRCDTRIAAEDFLPTAPFGHLDDPGTHQRFATWLGPTNKLVILTANPAYQRRSYLIHAEHGTWEDGVWYSNTDYQPPTPTTWTTQTDQPCPICTATVLDPHADYCLACGSCLDCAEYHTDCLCWPSFTAGQRAAEAADRADWLDHDAEEIPGALPHLLTEDRPRPARR